MVERKKGKAKGGSAVNPAAMAIVASHKDDTVKIEAQVETNPEAEKAEGEVKPGDKTEEVLMQPVHVVAGEIDTEVSKDEESTIQVDPEFDQEQQRAARKSSLRLRFHDNPGDLMTSDLSDEDREIIAELIAEQGQVVVEYSATTGRLNHEKDALERKLDATIAKLGNATGLIATTVKETMGQVGNETATAIDGLNATVVDVLGRNNGVKNAVTKIGDDVSKDIAGLKGRLDGIKSVEGKVDGVGAMLGKIDEKISSIKPSSSSWAWVAVIGLLLLTVAVIAVFLLTQDVTIKVEVQQAPAGNNTMKIVPPVPGGDAARATSQQVVPGGPSNPLVPSIIIGANPADPCEGLTGKANGECIMNQRRPTDFPDQDWNTVLTVFAEPVAVALEGGGMEACREKFLRATGDDDKALECQAAVKCLVSAEEKRRDCWRIATESFGTKLGMTN